MPVDIKNSTFKLNGKMVKEVMHSDFDLEFGMPRMDTYELFVSADNENEHKQVELNSNLYHINAKQAYTFLKRDIEKSKTNSNYVVLCKYIQRILFCPNLTHSNIFLSTSTLMLQCRHTQRVSMERDIAKKGSTKVVLYVTLHQI